MIGLCIVLCGAAICFVFVHSSVKKAKIEDEKHRLAMLEERNYQLFYFQLRLIKEFGGEVIQAMPEYKEILYSDKPLEAKYWVDVDKLVNLN